MIKLFEDLPSYKSWRDSQHGKSVGFFPTMGALHAGHGRSLKKMRERCDRLVLSIFVNPTQFGPNEDYQKYPRTLSSDLEIAKSCGVDAVLIPQTEWIYPKGYSTFVQESSLTQYFCGPFRPGHFQGVTTIVLKLFNIVRPTLAGFGMKDAQQFFVLAKMVKDLNLDIKLLGLPTQRESDGLAYSSRNAYLAESERALAPRFYQVLSETARVLEQDQFTAEALSEQLHKATESLKAHGFDVQYFDCRSLPEFSEWDSKAGIVASAVKLGKTRLIDNVLMHFNSSQSKQLGFEIIDL